MNQEQVPRDNFEIFRISFIHITILSFSYVLLMFLSQFTIATVALQNRIPENVVDMTEEEKAEVQVQTVKEFEILLKNNPEKINEEYIEAVTKTTPSLLFLQNILWFIAFVLPTYFVFTKLIHAKINDLSDELGIDQISRGFIAGIIIFLLMLAVSMIFSFFDFKPKVNEFQTRLFTNLKGDYYLLAWSIYSIGLITGILEEVVFRGFLLTHFVNRGLEKEGLMITSIIFGMLHFSFDASPIVPVLLTVVGILFGSLYLQSRNIWISIGAHATYNSLGLITAYFLGDKLL